ncbi:MAG: oligosaccharide flippase family protein [Thermoflexales bacterium]|nr:oligosaccharide flippase family protein [Thermoflexales bacterium]
MRETLKRLARFTAGYSLSALIGPLFTLLLTPLYTRALEPADYGVVDVLMTLSALLVAISMLGMDQALSAHFFDKGDTAEADAWRRNLTTTALMVVTGVAIVAALGLALFAEPLAAQLFHDPARRVTVLLVAVNVAFLPVYNLTIHALRLRMQIARANAVSLTYLFTLIGAAVTMVLGLRMRATGIVAANALASVAASVIGIVLAAGPLRGRPSPALGRSLLGVGIGVLPGALGMLIFTNIDRPLLTQFVSAADVGLYSIANKLASMVFVAMSPIFAAWWPIALEMAGRPEASRQFPRFFEYFLSAGFMLALGIGLFAPEILQVFARDAYVPAAPYALALMAYNGPIGFAFALLQIGLVSRKRTGLTSLAFLVSATTNITLNLILMPRLGVWGAVWATLAAGMVQTVLLFRFAQSVYPIRYRWLRVLALFGGYGVITAAFLLTPAPWSFWARALAIGLMAALIILVGVATPRQIVDGVGMLRRYAIRLLGRPASFDGREQH